jgi:hypothetical protein
VTAPMCGEGCHELDRLIYPPRPISDLVGPQTVARYSVSKCCLECGEPLTSEARKRRDDLCGECAA